MNIEYEEINPIYLRNEPIYEIIRKCNDDILIVEIFSKEYESNDFVLFYFSDSVKSKKIIQLTNEYAQQNAVVIGACKKSISFIDKKIGELKNQFDLVFENLTETQFEDLVEACYGTKSGEIHGDPSDWILLKSKNDNLCYVISAEGDSINNVTELISEKLKQKLTKDNAKKTNLIWSLEKQDSDSLTMSDVATSINKISEVIETGTEIEVKLWYDFQNKNLVKKYKLVCVFSFI